MSSKSGWFLKIMKTGVTMLKIQLWNDIQQLFYILIIFQYFWSYKRSFLTPILWFMFVMLTWEHLLQSLHDGRIGSFGVHDDFTGVWMSYNDGHPPPRGVEGQDVQHLEPQQRVVGQLDRHMMRGALQHGEPISLCCVNESGLVWTVCFVTHLLRPRHLLPRGAVKLVFIDGESICECLLFSLEELRGGEKMSQRRLSKPRMKGTSWEWVTPSFDLEK